MLNARIHCFSAIVIQQFPWFHQDDWGFVLVAIYITMSKLSILIILWSLGGILDRKPMSIYTLDRLTVIV